jgi:hypothetical protein
MLQNSTTLEKDVMGPCGETYPTSDGVNQAMNIKTEEVSDTEEEEEDPPLPMTFVEIKAEPEVRYMFLHVHY